VSLDDVAAEAARLWQRLGAGAVLWLSGEVGSGKTTFVQALTRAAGTAQAALSPTFALLHAYDSPAGPIFHADCYRLKQPSDAADLDLDALAHRGRLLIIEWPERAGASAPPPTAHIRLSHVADPARRRLEYVA
jgi:tRNA threonylcarbamoyl adenosine modification protein YjeE